MGPRSSGEVQADPDSAAEVGTLPQIVVFPVAELSRDDPSVHRVLHAFLEGLKRLVFGNIGLILSVQRWNVFKTDIDCENDTHDCEDE